jgi:hypothetical protein
VRPAAWGALRGEPCFRMTKTRRRSRWSHLRLARARLARHGKPRLRRRRPRPSGLSGSPRPLKKALAAARPVAGANQDLDGGACRLRCPPQPERGRGSPEEGPRSAPAWFRRGGAYPPAVGRLPIRSSESRTAGPSQASTRRGRRCHLPSSHTPDCGRLGDEGKSP